MDNFGYTAPNDCDGDYDVDDDYGDYGDMQAVAVRVHYGAPRAAEPSADAPGPLRHPVGLIPGTRQHFGCQRMREGFAEHPARWLPLRKQGTGLCMAISNIHCILTLYVEGIVTDAVRLCFHTLRLCQGALVDCLVVDMGAGAMMMPCRLRCG